MNNYTCNHIGRTSWQMKKKKKKKTILHSQTLLYLFYQPILQLTLHPNFYFYMQPNKMINYLKYCLRI